MLNNKVYPKKRSAYDHDHYIKHPQYGLSCQLYFICKICFLNKRYDQFINGSMSRLIRLRKKGDRICDDCRLYLNELDRTERLEKEQTQIDNMLKKLCEQPDIQMSTVVAITPSLVEDKIVICIGRVDKDYYEINNLKEFIDFEDAKIYALKFAKAVNTNHIFEIRLFNDGSSECIKVMQ